MKRLAFSYIFLLLFAGDMMGQSVPTDKKWWKEASSLPDLSTQFLRDSDGDGIGDLKGIISKLDYIKKLGIDVVWLNPIYSSPNDDNGYDVSDYRNIMKDFGTMWLILIP